MKKRIPVIFYLFLISINLFSQIEHVPNGGFENYKNTKVKVWNGTQYKNIANNWTSANLVRFKPENDSSLNLVEVELNNSENNYVELFSRNKVNISVNAIQTKLNSPLKRGQIYLLKATIQPTSGCCSYYIKSCKFIFTDTSFCNNNYGHIEKPYVLLQKCNDEFIENKSTILKKYIAIGNEKFLTIEMNSDFKQLLKIACPPNESCQDLFFDIDYYIDNISITEISDTTEINCDDNSITKYTKDAVLVLPNINFKTNSDSLLSSSFDELAKLLNELKSNPKLVIEISGHTDDVGNAESNLKLSEARAKSVKRYLVGKGINASRIQTKGEGYNKPLAKTTDEASRAKNRRVEVKVLKN